MNAHTYSKSPNKFEENLSERKLMATVFWQRKGVLMVEFMQQGTAIMSKVYCETLNNYVGPFRTKGMEC
jgi:hypothetical protein